MRVFNNCEIEANKRPGDANVSRMRESMINRKNDIAKGGWGK